MKQLLTSCGGEEFIPLFAKKELTFKEVQYMEDKDLRGVRNNSAKCFLKPSKCYVLYTYRLSVDSVDYW